MPPRKFYKKKFTKKRYVKKQSTISRMLHGAHTGLQSGIRLAKTVMYMKNMINCEKKFFDVSAAVVPTSAAPTATLLNNVAEGDDYNQRNGRSLLCDSVHVRWTAKGNNAATNTVLKFVIVMDKKPDSALPCLYGQVYGSNSTIAQYDKANESDRFVIIKQQLVLLNTGSGMARQGDFYISLKGIHIKYDFTGGAIGDLETNALHLLATSDEATNAPSLGFTSRFSYYDN